MQFRDTVQRRQAQRRRSWLALNLPKDFAHKEDLCIVGDIAGGVAIQPMSDQQVVDALREESDWVEETIDNANASEVQSRGHREHMQMQPGLTPNFWERRTAGKASRSVGRTTRRRRRQDRSVRST